MSIIVCDNCSKYVDEDVNVVFYHNNNRAYCELCAEELNFTTDDGIYNG